MPDSLKKCWDGLKKKVLEFDKKYPTAHVICLAKIDNRIVCEGSDKIKKMSLESIKEKYKNRLAACTSPPVTPPDAQGTKGKDVASSNLPVLQLTLQIVNTPATNAKQTHAKSNTPVLATNNVDANAKQTHDKSKTSVVAQLSLSGLNTSTLVSKEKADDPKIISSTPNPLGVNKSLMLCIVQFKHLASKTSPIKTRGSTGKEKYNQNKHFVPMVTRSGKSNGTHSAVQATVGNVKDKNSPAKTSTAMVGLSNPSDVNRSAIPGKDSHGTGTYEQMETSPTLVGLSTLSDGECSATKDPGIGVKEKYTPTKSFAVVAQSSPSSLNNSDPDIVIPLESIKTESIWKPVFPTNMIQLLTVKIQSFPVLMEMEKKIEKKM